MTARTIVTRTALALGIVAALAGCTGTAATTHTATRAASSAAVYDSRIDPTCAMGGGCDGTLPLWTKVNPTSDDCATLRDMVRRGQLQERAVYAPTAPCYRRSIATVRA